MSEIAADRHRTVRGSFLLDAVIALAVVSICGLPLAVEAVRRMKSRAARLHAAEMRLRVVEGARSFQLSPGTSGEWRLRHPDWNVVVRRGETVDLLLDELPARIEWRSPGGAESTDEWLLFVGGRVVMRSVATR